MFGLIKRFFRFFWKEKSRGSKTRFACSSLMHFGWWVEHQVGVVCGFLMVSPAPLHPVRLCDHLFHICS